MKVAFACSPGEAVIRFQMFACLWLADFFVDLLEIEDIVPPPEIGSVFS